MKRFVTGQAREQATLFPEYLEDFIAEDNPVRVIDGKRPVQTVVGGSNAETATEAP